MGDHWRLTAGPRPFTLTEALDKLEVPPGSPVTFRQLVKPETGRTCHELIAIERLPVSIDLSSDETLSDMLGRLGASAPEENVGDADQEVRLIRVSRDGGECPVPVAVVAYVG
jgi:hypothetical protein